MGMVWRQHQGMPDLTTRHAANAAVAPLAFEQDGVLSRRQLSTLGISRWTVRAELRAGRWRAHHKQTIAVHTGQLSDRAKHWHAVFEAGSRSVLDGTGSLIPAGLRGFETARICVSIPRGTKVLGSPGVTVRQTRRLKASDVMPVGIPRVRTEIAAVRAALWAESDRQAALLLTMTVQQRLARAEDIAIALLTVRRHKRRNFLHRVMLDIVGGAQSIGELDFIESCRRRGLPDPDRQAVRRGTNGRYYLDNYWDRYHLVVEIDGIQHQFATAIVSDALRQNDISLRHDTVLRIPLLGLRVAEDEFFAQIETALVDAGWCRNIS